jgi:hypothetical protein
LGSLSDRDENLTDFIACIPHEIQADWDAKYAPLLAGFPLNLMFIRIRKPKNGEGPIQIVSSLYEFDFDTFRESPDKRQMTYCSPANSEYRVEVVIYREKSVIEVSKFRGRNLLWQADGTTFDGTMVQATMCGMEPDELADNSPPS